MKDEDKTKEELINELVEMRQKLEEYNYLGKNYNQATNSVLIKNQQLEIIIGKSFDGIYIIDEEGRIIEWNISMERTFGLNRKESLGCYQDHVKVKPDN